MNASTMVLGTSALLFAIGIGGLLLRRNPLGLLMSIELLLNAANLTLVLAARRVGSVDAEGAGLLVLVLAAAEAAVGLPLALLLFRDRDHTDADEPSEVRG